LQRWAVDRLHLRTDVQTEDLPPVVAARVGILMNDTVTVRYIVDNVDEALDFYTSHLDFTVENRPAPAFVILARGPLRLLLSSAVGPGGAAQTMPEGRRPEPGGWNRIQLTVDDLASTVDRLREAGLSFRSDIITGRGGDQILLDDPAGNPIELFQPPAR
jgi:catechol 2,3-dioxygenase-like lactoylglutathione lyase family enzyme